MKRARQSWTIRVFGTAAITALVSIILHYTTEVELGSGALGAAWTSLLTSLLGIVLRYRTRVPLQRRPPARKTPPTVVVLLLLAPFSVQCGGAFGASAEKAGWCAAKCVASCGGAWVADLIGAASAPKVASLNYDRDPGIIHDGSRLFYHVEGPDKQPVVYLGRLQGEKLVRDLGRMQAGYFVDDSGGPAQLVLLSPEPRLYCASLERMDGAGDAAPGYVPDDPPESKAEFVERFGALPVWR